MVDALTGKNEQNEVTMLGHFSEEAVMAFIQMSCENKGLDYSETFDFRRCQRPDGTFYGTLGTCKPPAKEVPGLLTGGGGVKETLKRIKEHAKANKGQDDERVMGRRLLLKPLKRR